MQSFISDKTMMITRRTAINTDQIMVADRITVDKYTATCQKITQKGALFLLDQYLDRAYPMNKKDTNQGGYEASDLRKTLQSEEVLKIFAGYRDRMQPFDNGDLLRIPTYGEIFGGKDGRYFETDGHKQWTLMKDSKNRISFQDNFPRWGWLQNQHFSRTDFAVVSTTGRPNYDSASSFNCVRPVFLIV